MTGRIERNSPIAPYREAAPPPEPRLVLDLKFPNDRYLRVETVGDRVRLSIITDINGTDQRVEASTHVMPADAMKIAAALCSAASEVARV